MRHVDIAIIGAGVSGLCALDTCRSKKDVDVVVIAPEVGGRLRVSPVTSSNVGALFIGGDARASRRFVKAGKRLRLRDVAFVHHDTVAPFHFQWSRLGEYTRVLKRVTQFRSSFHQFQARSLDIGSAAALRESKTLSVDAVTPAATMLEAGGFQRLADEMFTPIVRACTMATPERLSVLEYLHVLMHLVVPVHECVFDDDAAKDALGPSWLQDEVNNLTRSPQGWVIATRNGDALLAKNVILATPPERAARLLGERETRQGENVVVTCVQGMPRQSYATKPIIVFASGPTTLIRNEGNGTFTVCSFDKQPPLDEYFSPWKEVDHAIWHPAFLVGQHEWLPLEPQPSLFLAGDYNLIGVEDAAIAGIAAARAALRTISS